MTTPVEQLRALLERATAQDNDAGAMTPGRQALVDAIRAAGFDPLAVFTLARSRQLDPGQEDALNLYRRVLVEDDHLQTHLEERRP